MSTYKPMTVRELIERLEKLEDQDAPILYGEDRCSSEGESWYTVIDGIETSFAVDIGEHEYRTFEDTDEGNGQRVYIIW